MNLQITAPEVRVIDAQGKQLGVLAIADAKKLAQEQAVDLIEIAPQAKPPVVRLIAFKKFKYLEEKKEKEARRHTKETELKEVRISPFIGQHDLDTALEKIKRFLKEGDLVKISVVFTGRQMAHQEFGPKMIKRVMLTLETLALQDREPRFEGRRYVTVVKPTKGKVSDVSKVPEVSQAKNNP